MLLRHLLRPAEAVQGRHRVPGVEGDHQVDERHDQAPVERRPGFQKVFPLQKRPVQGHRGARRHGCEGGGVPPGRELEGAPHHGFQRRRGQPEVHGDDEGLVREADADQPRDPPVRLRGVRGQGRRGGLPQDGGDAQEGRLDGGEDGDGGRAGVRRGFGVLEARSAVHDVGEREGQRKVQDAGGDGERVEGGQGRVVEAGEGAVAGVLRQVQREPPPGQDRASLDGQLRHRGDVKGGGGVPRAEDQQELREEAEAVRGEDRAEGAAVEEERAGSEGVLQLNCLMCF